MPSFIPPSPLQGTLMWPSTHIRCLSLLAICLGFVFYLGARAPRRRRRLHRTPILAQHHHKDPKIKTASGSEYQLADQDQQQQQEHQTTTTATTTMGSQSDPFSRPDQVPPFRVLVLGGAYGGLSAALSLVDLSEGRPARTGSGPAPDHDGTIPLQVTIVDERDGYYHLIGSPLALADEAYASRAWVKYSDMPALTSTPKITMIQGSAIHIDPASKHATIALHHHHKSSSTAEQQQKQHHIQIPYDYLVVATGLRRVWPVVPQALTRETYLAEAQGHIDRVRRAAAAGGGVLVVGGGAVGIEMAAELKLTHPAADVTLLHSHDQLLSAEAALPDGAKDLALALLHEAGVKTLLGRRVASTRQVVAADGKEEEGEGDEGEGEGEGEEEEEEEEEEQQQQQQEKGQNKDTLTEVTLTNGEMLRARVVIMAVSHGKPSTAFLPRAALDAEGFVAARATLMFPAGAVPHAESHFAVGDAVRWSGIKRCGAAMHFGYFAAHNIHELMRQELQGRAPAFKELGEIPAMIGLAVGKKAMSYSPGQGLAAGEDVMKVFFGNDLGFDICWRYMKLGLPMGGQDKTKK